MADRQRRYTQEELARRGQNLYESGIRQHVEAGNEGKIVAIDVETGAFEVDENVVPATNRLFEQYPDAQPWVIRIGHRTVDHFEAMIKAFGGAPTLRHPPTFYLEQKKKSSQPILLTCSRCGCKDSMGDGLYDDGEWIGGACIAGMAYPN